MDICWRCFLLSFKTFGEPRWASVCQRLKKVKKPKSSPTADAAPEALLYSPYFSFLVSFHHYETHLHHACPVTSLAHLKKRIQSRLSLHYFCPISWSIAGASIKCFREKETDVLQQQKHEENNVFLRVLVQWKCVKQILFDWTLKQWPFYLIWRGTVLWNENVEFGRSGKFTSTCSLTKGCGTSRGFMADLVWRHKNFKMFAPHLLLWLHCTQQRFGKKNPRGPLGGLSRSPMYRGCRFNSQPATLCCTSSPLSLCTTFLSQLKLQNLSLKKIEKHMKCLLHALVIMPQVFKYNHLWGVPLLRSALQLCASGFQDTANATWCETGWTLRFGIWIIPI